MGKQESRVGSKETTTNPHKGKQSYKSTLQKREHLSQSEKDQRILPQRSDTEFMVAALKHRGGTRWLYTGKQDNKAIKTVHKTTE